MIKGTTPSSRRNRWRAPRRRRPIDQPTSPSLGGASKAMGKTVRDRKPIRWFTWGLTFTVVMTLSAGLGASLALITPFRLGQTNGSGPITLKDLFSQGLDYGVARPVNILVMGVDRNPDAKEGTPEVFASRSDTMLLVRLDPTNHKVNILSIPRDTQVELPELGEAKINHANWKGGPKLAITTVSQTLNNVPIDRYVRISTGAFREIVEVLGGVEVYVPKEMKYEDKTQGLSIDLQPGKQVLNGQQAEGFARFRNEDSGDIGRAQRQQILLKALQKRLTNPLMLAKVPQIFSVLQKYIDSDLSMGEMLALTQFGLQLKPSQLQMVLLPGRFSSPDEFESSYWLMDVEGMDRVMASYFEVTPPEESAALAEVDPEQDYWLRIDVQNATEDPNAAYVMVNYLNQLGYSNVYVDESGVEPVNKTQVIPQWGQVDSARRLQAQLDKSELTVNSTGKLQSDLTVRVGNDWLRSQQARDSQAEVEQRGIPLDEGEASPLTPPWESEVEQPL